MKRFLFTLFGLTLLVGQYNTGIVRAEACDVSSDSPSATVNVPVLPKAGEYNIWTRVQTPDASNTRFRLEINGNSCFVVFNDGPVQEWAWVTSSGNRSDARNVNYNFGSTTNNKIKIIGMDEGVKVDRILVLQDSCVPEGNGDNCRAGATTIATQATNQSIEQDPTGQVQGKVFVASLLTQSSKDVNKVQYFSDGKKVQESPGITPFDTTLVDNGIRTITTRIFWSDGTSEDVVSTVTVKNPLNTFSPLVRWLRLNQRLMMFVGFVSALISIFMLTLALAKIAQSRSKKRHAHGF